MNNYLEIDEKKKSIKPLNLDDFSVDDLKNYTQELLSEIKRVESEIKKKKLLQKDALKYFK